MGSIACETASLHSPSIYYTQHCAEHLTSAHLTGSHRSSEDAYGHRSMLLMWQCELHRPLTASEHFVYEAELGDV